MQYNIYECCGTYRIAIPSYSGWIPSYSGWHPSKIPLYSHSKPKMNVYNAYLCLQNNGDDNTVDCHCFAEDNTVTDFRVFFQTCAFERNGWSGRIKIRVCSYTRIGWNRSLGVRSARPIHCCTFGWSKPVAPKSMMPCSENATEYQYCKLKAWIG